MIIGCKNCDRVERFGEWHIPKDCGDHFTVTSNDGQEVFVFPKDIIKLKILCSHCEKVENKEI